jgi:hypothetical protein
MILVILTRNSKGDFMKKIICMMGLLALTSCSHMGCHKTGEQCNMHKKEQCSKCGSEKCEKCSKDHSQCPMDKAAAPAAEAPKK